MSTSKSAASLALPSLLCALLAACGGPDVPATGGPDAGPDSGTDAGTDGGTEVGVLTLSPGSAAVAAVAGQASTTAFMLGNEGTALLHFTVACAGGGTPDVASGAIAVNATAVITVAIAAFPSAGTQTVTCTIDPTDTPEASLTYTATITVAPAPVGKLTLSPASASTSVLVNQPGQSDFTLGNEGDAPLSFAVSCKVGGTNAAVTATPASGTLAPSATQPVSVGVPAFAAVGAQSIACSATTANGSGGPRSFTLSVQVQGGTTLGHLTLTPAASSSNRQVGQSGTTSFSIGNDGTAALSYSVACTNGATATPASGALAIGAAQAVSVQFAAWTTPGTFAVVCSVTTSDGSGGPLAHTSTVTVTAVPVGKLTLTPASVALSRLINQASTAQLTLGNAGNATLNQATTCTLGATPAPTSAAIAAGATLDVTVTIPAFATAGTRTVTCTVDPTDTPDASLTFTVTLTVSDGTAPASPCGAKGAVWNDLNALTGQALHDALSTRISTGTSALSYSAAGTYVHDANSIDKEADGNIECVYSGERVPAASNGFNTEHSWPQSFFNEALPMKSDLHHLFPTDPTPNGYRGNDFFDNVTCGSSCPYMSTTTCGTATNCTAGGVSKLGKNAAGRDVYEVRQKQRGNTARALFYFAVRYPAQVNSSDSNCDAASSPHCFPDWEQATLRQWHAQDPVDAAECARNDAIEALQHNRNPFVDRPDFLDKITAF